MKGTRRCGQLIMAVRPIAKITFRRQVITRVERLQGSRVCTYTCSVAGGCDIFMLTLFEKQELQI